MHRPAAPSIPVVFALAVALLVPDRALAQAGVKGGFSSATISFAPAGGSPELTNTQRQTGLAGGLFLLLPGNSAGGVQVEALVIQKGARNLLRRDDRMRLTYLEIPVVIHLDVLQRDPGAVYVVAGPSFAYNLQASYEDDGVKEEIRNDIHKVDASLHLGGGVEYGPVSLEARYLWGLRRVFEDGDLEGAFRNRAFVVTAGVRFGR